jgi:2-polyprenyl-3-methyl-5-hydroxy-6-metoxy-1,4-benzoquinol methylase
VSRYTAEFGEGGAHGHCRDLLARAGLDSGVVLDLGSASGPLAEPVAELGFTYVGADVDRAAVDELSGRGFEAHLLDLRGDDDQLDAALATIVGDRPVAAVLLLDVIEHLVDPGPTLRAIARLGSPERRPLLVVSVPNVSHVDLGAKLLAGRWDLTEIGLLDETHVRFFNAERVAETLGSAGWRQVDEYDVVNPFSDQQFPPDAPVLRSGVPLRLLLERVRHDADPYGETYQFVRSFQQGPVLAEQGALVAVGSEADAEAGAETSTDGPFLTVVVRVRGSSDAAGEQPAVLRDLADQTLGDFEVVVSYADGAAGADQGHLPDALSQPVRDLKPEPDWRNGAIAEARGRYLAFVDDRTRLAPEFVATIHRLVGEMPGRVVQVGAVLVESAHAGDAGRSYAEATEAAPPVDLDPLDLVSMRPFGFVALAAHAVPREACVTTGVRFPSEQRLGAMTLFLLRCIELCGIARTDEAVSAVEATAVRTMADDLAYLRSELGSEPLMIPPGGGSHLLEMREAIARSAHDGIEQRLAATNEQLGAVSALLVQRDHELARVTAERDRLRATDDRRLRTRVRRRLARIARRI